MNSHDKRNKFIHHATTNRMHVKVSHSECKKFSHRVFPPLQSQAENISGFLGWVFKARSRRSIQALQKTYLHEL